MGGWRRLRLRWIAVFVSLEKVRGMRGGRGRTGSHSELVRTRASLGSPVVMELTDPVTAIALILLPYSFALFSSSRALSSCQYIPFPVN